MAENLGLDETSVRDARHIQVKLEAREDNHMYFEALIE